MTVSRLQQVAGHRYVMILVVALLAGLSLNLGTIRIARAATITVTTTLDEVTVDGNCSLREAIIAANTHAAVDACPAGGASDTINVPAGTYRLTIAGADEDAGATGDLDIRSNLAISGTGSGTTIIDGNQLDRVFQVHPGVTASISGLTIQNGHAQDSDGGGVLNQGTLTLTDDVIDGNTVTSGEVGPVTTGTSVNGGGIRNEGTLTLARTSVTNNSVSTNEGNVTGGGISSMGSLTLNDSLVRGNTGTANSLHYFSGQGEGGGIWSSGSLTLTRSTVSNNAISGHSAGDGGGIAVASGTLLLDRSIVQDNAANGGESPPPVAGSGGGILNRGTTTISQSTISGNSSRLRAPGLDIGEAGGGGGIASTGTLSLTNSTVSGNIAEGAVDRQSGLGGGMELDGTTTIANSTITANTAAGGGGISSLSDAALSIRNSILAGNSASSGQGQDCRATLTSQGYNLLGSSTGCTITGTTTGNLLDVAPGLGPLQDNGGPTPTHALLPGSPAIDAGNPGTPGSGGNTCEATDQRGIARPQDGDGNGIARCDMGAFELAPSDQAPPVCKLVTVGTDAQGHPFLDVQVHDTGSGLATIEVLDEVNFTATVPSFTVGTTEAVTVHASGVDPGNPSRLTLRITDQAGNATTCAAVDVLVVKSEQRPTDVTLSGIPSGEDLLVVANGSPGAQMLQVSANGVRLWVRHLADEEVRDLDISSALKTGSNNTITIRVWGQPGASVDLVLWSGER